jgi:hypothetical protein
MCIIVDDDDGDVDDDDDIAGLATGSLAHRPLARRI